MANARRPQNNTNDSMDSIIARIAALEAPVAASYFMTGNVAVTADNKVNYDGKEYDTHNAVTTGAGVWKFVAPKAGYYLVAASVNTNASTAIFLWKNGVKYKVVGFDTSATDASWANVIFLNQNDELDVRPAASVTFQGNNTTLVNAGNNLAISLVK